MKTQDIKIITKAIRERFGRVSIEASSKDYFKTPTRPEFTTLNCGLGEGGEDYDLSDLWPIRDTSAKQWALELCTAPFAMLDLYIYESHSAEREMITNVQVTWKEGKIVSVVHQNYPEGEILWSAEV